MCLLLDGDACGTHHKSTGKCGRFIVGLVVFGVGQVVDDVGDVGVIKEPRVFSGVVGVNACRSILPAQKFGDRKSTRLNSSHVAISYAVFCLKKKKKWR